MLECSQYSCYTKTYVPTVFMSEQAVVVTHDLSFAKMFDTIIVIDQGTIVQSGTFDELHETGTLVKTCEAT